VGQPADVDLGEEAIVAEDLPLGDDLEPGKNSSAACSLVSATYVCELMLTLVPPARR
jgi:hypothetical protein